MSTTIPVSEMPPQQERERDDLGRDLTTNEVFPVKETFLVLWVCAPKSMPMEEVQAAVDKMPAAGTSHGWQVEKREHDNWALQSPGLCSENSNRQHWLCSC